MEFLVTGKIQSLSKTFFEPLSLNHKIITAAEDIDSTIIGKHVKNYNCSPLDEDFLHLFHTHSFEGVIHFVDGLEESEETTFGINELINILDKCVLSKVQKIIIVSSTYIYNGMDHPSEESIPRPTTRKGNLLLAYEKICEMYRDNYGLAITVLHIPFLFGEYDRYSFFGKILYNMHELQEVEIPGRPEQIVEFLSQKDFAQLIERILIEQKIDIPMINISGASSISIQGIYSLLDRQGKGQNISFSQNELLTGPPVASRIAEKHYKWQPTTTITEELPNMLEAIKIHKVKRNKTKWQQLVDFYHQHSFILIALELFIGFVLMEYLNTVSTILIQFYMIDFRLLYVVLFTAVHGRKAGIIAGILASYSIFRGYQLSGVDWRIVFYNVENWLPFVGYIVTALLLGYIRDRKDMEIVDKKIENNYLTKRYILLNDLYETAVSSKEQYKKQIINYRDSFGRIFSIISKLDKVNPQEIFEESLYALEEFLENQSIAIYTFGEDARYAQLDICSKAITSEINETIDMQQYPRLLENIGKNKVWVNKEQLADYPDYVFSVYKDQIPAILICVQEAEFEQMTLSYKNNFNIICNIIDFSLLHAWKYTEHNQKKSIENKMIQMNQYKTKQNFNLSQEHTQEERREKNDKE